MSRAPHAGVLAALVGVAALALVAPAAAHAVDPVATVSAVATSSTGVVPAAPAPVTEGAEGPATSALLPTTTTTPGTAAGSERRPVGTVVRILIAGFLVVALGLAGMTWWFVRATRPIHRRRVRV